MRISGAEVIVLCASSRVREREIGAVLPAALDAGAAARGIMRNWVRYNQTCYLLIEEHAWLIWDLPCCLRSQDLTIEAGRLQLQSTGTRHLYPRS